MATFTPFRYVPHRSVHAIVAKGSGMALLPRIHLPRTPVYRPSSDPYSRAIMEGMNDPYAQPIQHEDPPDLDLKILEVLREAAQSARLLAQTISQSDEQVGVDAVRLGLVGLASRGLARPSGRVSLRAEMDADEPTLLAEEAAPLWEITEEGRAVVEPYIGVARAPYDRGVGDDEVVVVVVVVDDERDVAGLVVLLLIALLTAVCAVYSLLTAAGVLGGG